MEIRHIMYILTLADQGNMTRASEKLNISQPALSQMLHHIQEETGLKMFVKDGRNLKLTEDGRFFYDEGNQLVEHYQRFRFLLDRRHNVNQTHLRYYCDIVDSSDEVLMMYKTFFPEVTFERNYCSSWQAIRKLKSGELDFVLSIDKVDDPDEDLVSQLLIDEPVYAVVNDSLTNQVESSAGYVFEKRGVYLKALPHKNLMIYQNEGRLTDLISGFFDKSGVAVPEINSVYNPMIMVQRNDGYALIPESTYNYYFRTEKLECCKGYMILDGGVSRKVWLSYRKDIVGSALHDGFFRYLEDYHRIIMAEKNIPERSRFSTKERFCLLEN